MFSAAKRIAVSAVLFTLFALEAAGVGNAVFERDRLDEEALVDEIVNDINEVGAGSRIASVIQERKEDHENPDLNGISGRCDSRNGKRQDPHQHGKLDRACIRMLIRISPERTRDRKATEVSEHVDELYPPDREGKLVGV